MSEYNDPEEMISMMEWIVDRYNFIGGETYLNDRDRRLRELREDFEQLYHKTNSVVADYDGSDDKTIFKWYNDVLEEADQVLNPGLEGQERLEIEYLESDSVTWDEFLD